MPNDIWIGDVVRALPLGRDPTQREAILRCLGFAATARLDPESDTGLDSLAREEHAESQTPQQPRPLPENARTPVGPRQSSASDGAAELPLLSPVRAGTDVGVRLEATPIAESRPEHVSPRLPYLPLFPPRLSGSIVRAALSVRVNEGPIDVPKLVADIAHGKPVTVPPRRPVPTLRFGVQILVDRGIGMQPFRRDQDELVERIGMIVGRERTEIGYFAGSPLHGTGPGPTWTWDEYRPPLRGTKVLLLSDLGLSAAAVDPLRTTRDEWEAFAATVARSGCRLIAFVPWPVSAAPRWLAALSQLVTWDRHVTAAQAAARLS